MIGLSLLSDLFRFARWHRCMGTLDHHIRLHRNLAIYLSAFALTPGKAGATVRSISIPTVSAARKASVPFFQSGCSTERLLDLVAFGLLALVVVIFPEHRLWVLGTVSCLVAVVLWLHSGLISSVVGHLTKGSLGVHASKYVSYHCCSSVCSPSCQGSASKPFGLGYLRFFALPDRGLVGIRSFADHPYRHLL